MNEYIEQREMSGFPVSIGTGLALETIFNPEMEVADEGREFTKLEDPNYYDIYLINVATLTRNMLSAIETGKKEKVRPNDYIEAIKEEIDIIKALFANSGLRVQFFYNTHQYYHKAYPTQMRLANTPKQLHELNTIKHVGEKLTSEGATVRKFHHLLTYDKGYRALLLSHYPVELLSYVNFRTLDLLESNTGKIKQRKDYNTKYFKVPNEDLSFTPFFEYLLTVFGDKVMFIPKNIKVRLDVLGQLRKLNVNPLTTELSLRNKLK